MLVFEITPAYTEVLAQMHRQCFDTYWDEAQFIQLLSLPTTHGLMCECGFILFSTVLDEAEIMTFCVLPQSRRMGIGRLLLSHMIEWAKTHHMHRIFLEVSEENLPAVTCMNSSDLFSCPNARIIIKHRMGLKTRFVW